MDKRINELSDKLFKAVDPTDESYSYNDFINEYGHMYEQPSDMEYHLLNLNFVNTSENPDPEYATEGSSGFDLRASEDSTIEPGNYEIVPTGLFFEIPNSFEIQVRPRSGLAAKHGVTVLNTPGTIDSDYRGEIKVILINHGKESFKIQKGDRIAQGVIAQTSTSYIKLNKVSSISDNTERSSGGFGSTGIK
jgi:dUTP pyrophosphatase